MLSLFEPRIETSKNVVCAISKGSDQPSHTHSLIRVFASRLDIISLLIFLINIIWASNNVVHVSVTSKGSDQPAHTRSLIRAIASRLNIL